MGNDLASLSSVQQKRINDLEAELGVVLVAYKDYRPEDENGASSTVET